MVNSLLFIYYALGSCTYMCPKFISLVPNSSNFIVCNSVCRYIYAYENKDGLFSDRLSNLWCSGVLLKFSRRLEKSDISRRQDQNQQSFHSEWRGLKRCQKH